MTRHVDRRRIAKHDLIEIWHYIAQDSPPAADTMLDRIEAKLAMLADHPLLGTPRPKLKPEMRSAPVGNYTLFLSSDEARNRADPRDPRLPRSLEGLPRALTPLPAPHNFS